RLPYREAVGEPLGHFIAHENLPFQLAYRPFRPRQPEVEGRADLCGGRGAACHGDTEFLGSSRRLPSPSRDETRGEDQRERSGYQCAHQSILLEGDARHCNEFSMSRLAMRTSFQPPRSRRSCSRSTATSRFLASPRRSVSTIRV